MFYNGWMKALENNWLSYRKSYEFQTLFRVASAISNNKLLRKTLHIKKLKVPVSEMKRVSSPMFNKSV